MREGERLLNDLSHPPSQQEELSNHVLLFEKVRTRNGM